MLPFASELIVTFLMSTPPSMAARTSCGVSKSKNALVAPKRGSLATSIIFLIGMTWALTPGGAAWTIIVLRSSS